MVTGANKVERPILNLPAANQNELVCLKFTSAQAKREFLERYCRELPKNQQGPAPSKALIDRAKVVIVEEAKGVLQVRTGRVRAAATRQLNQTFQHKFAGPPRERNKQLSSLFKKT